MRASRTEERVVDAGNSMDNWKRAAVWGSVIAGGILLATGRKTAGLVLAGAGLAALAAEYPETFEEVWERGPAYVKHGTRILSVLGVLGDYMADRGRRARAREWSGLLEE